MERRKCFNNFIGPYGGNKNLGLFYCFLVWEGKNTRWLSKRLPESVARNSAMTLDVVHSGPAKVLPGSEVLSKKQQQQVEIMKRILQSVKSESPAPVSKSASLYAVSDSPAVALSPQECSVSNPLHNEKRGCSLKRQMRKGRRSYNREWRPQYLLN